KDVPRSTQNCPVPRAMMAQKGKHRQHAWLSVTGHFTMRHTARTALCFLVADKRHRIPRRPLHRFVYRHTRHGLRRLIFATERQEWRCDDYRPGLVAAVASIRKRSRNVPPILLLTPDNMEPPPGIDRVVRIDPGSFASVRGAFYEFGVTVFFKLAVFSLSAFDRLVYMDADTLAVPDVSAMWDLRRLCDRGFYGVRESQEFGAHTDAAVGKFNAGVMVLNRPMLDGRAYEELMCLARSGATYDGGDQGVLHALLSRPGSPY